ncbi:hypothetical protein M5225_000266 [Vibrio vulnificus]|uniref:helix-turn-helix transcriptional regulator n=1 Tax=Vibrio vulnificus TaxID=672 RepID=UPI001A2F25A9|nr:hypothetical protein [Vibrio vulnificus]EHH1180606.1 hypothetical protein [Vibrio vulnificus]EHH1188653.1 hypothetical protein [Vibrio vulnificus]EHU4846326.1 hypothetical protein [Vibrio vulnificus]EHZ2900089.1 hypothetical protein [Vibrio vulnificus]EIA1302920.1 hypothetical protein [Vibrio vulnificus]
MTTKPSVSEHLVLLFEIYNRIPHSRKVTAQEIHSLLTEIGLERDIRTIQRNLDVLVQYLGVVKDTRDRPYGYHREALPLKTFGARESILLQLAESWLVHCFPAEYKATINSVFTEVHNVKSRSSRLHNNHGHPSAFVSATPQIQTNYSASFNAVFEQLCMGVTNQTIVNIITEEKEQTIEPLCIWVHQHQLIVIFKHQETGYQHMQIERIQKATVSTFTFDSPETTELLAYLQHLDTPVSS